MQTAECELEIQVLQIRRPAACLAEDLPTLGVHLEYPLRLRYTAANSSAGRHAPCSAVV